MFKKVLKQTLAVVIAVCLLLCSIPMMAMAADETGAYLPYGETITESKVIAKGDGSDAVFGINKVTSNTYTFKSTNAGWQNNFFVRPAAFSLEGYDNVTVNFNIASQAEYDVWKYHTLFWFRDGNGNVLPYPMPNDLKEGDNTVTFDLSIAPSNFDMANVTEFCVKSTLQGWWGYGYGNNMTGSNSSNCGWTGSGDVDFTVSVSNLTANKVSYPTGTTKLNGGNFRPYGSLTPNLNYVNQSWEFAAPYDISDCETFEFEIFVSDAEKLKAEKDADGEVIVQSFNVQFRNPGDAYSGYSVSVNDIETGWNHFSVPVSSITYANNLSEVYFYLERNGVSYTPVTNYYIGIGNFAAKGGDVIDTIAPAMVNTHSNVLFKREGYFWKDIDVTGNTAIPSGDAQYVHLAANSSSVDAQKADYVEFDIYSEAAVTNNVEFWLSTGIAADSSRAKYAMPTLTAGWNHVEIKLSDFIAKDEEKASYDVSKLLSMHLGGTPAAASSSSLKWRMANLAFTTDNFFVPALKTDHILLDSVEGVVHSRDLTPGQNTFNASYINIKSTPLDTVGGEYIEMDIYASEATDSTFYFWVADNRESSTARGRYAIPALEKGWNHIALAATNCYAHNGFVFDGYNFCYPFLEGSPYSADHATGGTIKIANLAVTKFSPDINDTLKYTDVVWSNPSVYWQVSVGNGTRVPQNAAAYYPQFAGGETVDTTSASYVEFDIYSSADLSSSPTVWLSRNVWAESGRAAAGAGKTIEKGWNHICIDLKAFSTAGGEWGNPVIPFDRSILKSMFLEFTVAALEDSVKTVDLAMANIAFTNASAKLDGVYSNNMIFQRNKPINVTGWAKNGTEVKVDITDVYGNVVRTKSVVADETEQWKITLDAMEGGYDEYTLTLYGDGSEQKSISKVRIGEVYVASGQSNMDMKMWETYDGAQKYYNDSYDCPNISIYTIGDTYWQGADVPYEPDKNHVLGGWRLGNERSAHNVSAVAYHFADTMQQKLDVPVGVMTVALGGSSIFSWISREHIEADETLLNYLKSSGKYYDESNWSESNAQQKMSSLYNIKVATAAGLEVSGAIWYQGCNEVGISDGIYTRALEVLRDCYADTFCYDEGEMPFILVELASYGFADPTLPKMWDQMTAAAENNENFGAVTIYDLPLDWAYGEWAPFGMGGATIHPTTKEPVGERLAEAMYAMNYDSSYGESTAPLWTGDIRFEGKYAYLDFKYVGDGLGTPENAAIDGFSIADERGVFVNAKAEIVDANTVKVWSDTVANPVSVSYSYDNYSITSNLYGTQNGGVFLPVTPFITTNDPEIVRAQHNSWYSIDDATLVHTIGTDFDYFTAWTAEGATAEIVTDVKDWGDGSLKLTYSADNATFTASPTLTTADGGLFSDINYNYSYYDRIEFKVKNVGSALKLNRMALCSNGVWYYAEIDKSLSADSGWVSVTANLNNLIDENGNEYTNSNKLSSVTAINLVFSGANADGVVYVDTFQLGNSTYGGYKVNPDEVKTAYVGDVVNGFNYGSVDNTAYIGDRFIMHNTDGADVSDSDYLEFDLYINDISEVKRLNDLGYSFVMWISANSSSRWNNRCNFAINDQLTQSGWNHIRIALDDITYRESGFTFEHLHYFYITCNSGSDRTSTSLCVKLGNFVHTIHAGDLTADGSVDMLDLIRMKKIGLGEQVEYDNLALDVDRNSSYNFAVDFTALRKAIFASF